MTAEELRGALGAVSGYGELRMQENTQTSIGVIKGDVTSNVTNRTSGVSARVYDRGAWGMASSPDKTPGGLEYVTRAAQSNAAFLSGKMPAKAPALPGRPGQKESLLLTSRPRVTPRQKVDFLRDIDAYIEKKYPSLVSRSVHLSGINFEKTLVTTDGTYFRSFVPRTHVYIFMTADRDGVPVDLMDNPTGGLGEFEDLFENPEPLYERADRLYELIMKKREGVHAEGGLHTCVLAPSLAGILAHEAVGHTVECDLVKGGSIAGPLFGKQVASEKVSLVDFAHTAFGGLLDVPVFIDDEGIEAKDAVLIDKGILTGYMHNRETALEYGVEPTGNARAYGFADEPLIRMRNTCILPGTDKLEDMIAAVDDGYYLFNPGNGQADMTSEFMFSVAMGFEIKKGKLGRAILDTTVSGVAFEMLKTVTMVGDECLWASSGMCGKKQPMSTNMGGPAILCQINVGGQ